MPSQVFFTDLRATLRRPLLQKLDEMMDQAGLAQVVAKGDLTAIKLHFGELGNTAYLRPNYAARLVEAVKKLGGQPFLTDCNTLYVGSRADSASHVMTAVKNGFAPSVVGAPVIIADGLRGQNTTVVEMDLDECPKAYIGDDIIEADAIISLAHFKGHELTGFGGALKNLGMGCGSRQGKLYMHSDVSPQVALEKCIACGDCIRRCPATAIKLVKREKGQPAPLSSQHPELVAQKDNEKCIGCGDCVLTCPEGAMQIQWNAQIPIVMQRMVGHAAAALVEKEDKSLFVNFITQVSPACDCYPYQDAPIVNDIGICAGRDPVAVDQASVDLVNQAPGSAASGLKQAHAPGSDKFRDLYPQVDWQYQLEFAEEIGLGEREYELITI